MKKIVIFAIIFIVAFSTLPMFITHSGSETDNEYWRRIKIDNSRNSETLSDYQVFLNVTYDSDMQPDFDDLRFTWYKETSGQEVSIDYWLDKYVDSEYALVWVEVPSIRGLGQEVLYMYYGDPDAASASNGEETFVFFDDFLTDTTSNYEVWYNPKGEISWNPNGWLFLNATEQQAPGKASNVHAYHKTVLIDATVEKYWLETRGKSSGTGYLDYFGVGEPYKRDSYPSAYYELFCEVTQTNAYIASHYSPEGTPWEFGESYPIPSGKDEWYRFGVGTSPNGTVVGSFHDDDYNEIVTLVDHTIHQDNEWWVDLVGSRAHAELDETLHVYFDYVRVRKFTDPEPSYSIGEEEPLAATVDIDPDTLNLKSEGQWITAYIDLPEGYDVNDIRVETVMLEDAIPVEWGEIQDYVLMVKFDRVSVISYIYTILEIEYGDVTLKVTGELYDGTVFEGTDTIRVIFAGDINRDGKVNIIDLSMIGRRYGVTTEEPAYKEAVDLNSDGIIDIFDLAITALNYGATTPQ